MHFPDPLVIHYYTAIEQKHVHFLNYLMAFLLQLYAAEKIFSNWCKDAFLIYFHLFTTNLHLKVVTQRRILTRWRSTIGSRNRIVGKDDVIQKQISNKNPNKWGTTRCEAKMLRIELGRSGWNLVERRGSSKRRRIDRVEGDNAW
jgi:hypothetical protein